MVRARCQSQERLSPIQLLAAEVARGLATSSMPPGAVRRCARCRASIADARLRVVAFAASDG